MNTKFTTELLRPIVRLLVQKELFIENLSETLESELSAEQASEDLVECNSTQRS
jgi:hypothetical protein